MPVNNIWWILLAVSFAISVIFALVVGLIKSSSFFRIVAILFGIGVCAYIQAMFMNGGLSELIGGNATFNRQMIIVNIIIWLAALILCLAFSDVISKVIPYICLGLICIQSVGLITNFLSLPDASQVVDTYFAEDGMFELATDENCILLIVDSCDGRFVENALEEYPNLFGKLDGFTYFPNTLPTYSRTFPALPYLLSGEKHFFQKPYSEYISSAWKNSVVLNPLDQNGTDVRLYTDAIYSNRTILNIIDNCKCYDSADISLIRPVNLVKVMARIAAYKVAPYAIKNIFIYYSDIFRDNVLKTPADMTVSCNDVVFTDKLVQRGISVNTEYSSAFRLWHLVGTHAGADKNGKTMSEVLKEDFEIIDDIVAQMKELGVYDCSTIVIAADHGEEQKDVEKTTSALLLVKPKNAGRLSCSVSYSPISHDELIGTFLDAYGLSSDKYRTVFDIGENEQRSRYWYHRSGDETLEEYEIAGDAREFSNYSLTGKVWDLEFATINE